MNNNMALPRPELILDKNKERQEKARSDIIDWFHKLFVRHIENGEITASGGKIKFYNQIAIYQPEGSEFTFSVVEDYARPSGWDVKKEKFSDGSIWFIFSPAKPRPRGYGEDRQ